MNAAAPWPASSVEAEMVMIGPAPPVLLVPPGWCASACEAVSANAPTRAKSLRVIVVLHACRFVAKRGSKRSVRQAVEARGFCRRGRENQLEGGKANATEPARCAAETAARSARGQAPPRRHTP